MNIKKSDKKVTNSKICEKMSVYLFSDRKTKNKKQNHKMNERKRGEREREVG
jgi:hypothetical protein